MKLSSNSPSVRPVSPWPSTARRSSCRADPSVVAIMGSVEPGSISTSPEPGRIFSRLPSSRLLFPVLRQDVVNFLEALFPLLFGFGGGWWFHRHFDLLAVENVTCQLAQLFGGTVIARRHVRLRADQEPVFSAPVVVH